MKLKLIAFSMFGLALAAPPAYAHHSFAMFDRSKTITWVGTVVEYNWSNPHSHIVLAVTDDKDPAMNGTWDIEAGSPNIMLRQGWTKVTLKKGDKTTIVGHPLKDGTKGGSLAYGFDKSGKKLYVDVNHAD